MYSTTPDSNPGIPPAHRGAFAAGQRFGAYVIEREIARGGQGAILFARHERLGSPVALKLLLHADARSKARFTREAQVLARLGNPNVPKIHDVGEERGVSFMAMELIQGEDLYQRLKSRGVPDFAWSARVMAQVARVVQACHDRGILHRDLKPHNVLIEEGSERPVLVDFGLLKKDESVEGGLTVDGGALSLAGEMSGTPAYMAPEQADASLGQVGRWTDVYALGATLFHLLTGAPPFEGATSYNVITKLMAAKRPPDASNSGVPKPLAEVCRQAMAMQAEDRLDSAGELAERLDEVADVLEGKAAPAGKRGPRRGGLLSSALIALAGVGVALAIVSSAPRAGTLIVHSDHPAALLEGDRVLAQLDPIHPLELELPSGIHELVARADGLERALSVDVPVEGRTETHVVFLGQLRVEGPPGSTVTVYRADAVVSDLSGVPLKDRDVPALFDLLQGDYELELWTEGRHPSTTPVSMEEHEQFTLEVGPPEDLFLSLPRGHGVRLPPLTWDVDGDGTLDVIGASSTRIRNGNDAEVVAFSGRNGEVLWSYAGPVNQWGGLTLQTAGEQAPAVVSGEIREGLPGIVWLDPASGQPKQQYPLDNRAPYLRPPLKPIPLDPAGEGEHGFVVALDRLTKKENGRKQPAFLSVFLAGAAAPPGFIAPIPTLPEALGEPRSNDYGLHGVPLHRAGLPYGVLWHYKGRQLALEIPSGRLLAEVRPSRTSRWRGALHCPQPSRLGTLTGWNLGDERQETQEVVELVLLDPATLEERWRRVIATNAMVHGYGIARLALTPGQPAQLVIATDRAGLLFLDEESGDETTRISDLPAPLRDPRLFRQGERRLLALATSTADQAVLVILDPAQDYREVWRRTIGAYGWYVVADLDGDGDDELITSHEGNRILAIDPAIR